MSCPNLLCGHEVQDTDCHADFRREVRIRKLGRDVQPQCISVQCCCFAEVRLQEALYSDLGCSKQQLHNASPIFTLLLIHPESSRCPFFKPSSLITSLSGELLEVLGPFNGRISQPHHGEGALLEGCLLKDWIQDGIKALFHVFQKNRCAKLDAVLQISDVRHVQSESLEEGTGKPKKFTALLCLYSDISYSYSTIPWNLRTRLGCISHFEPWALMSGLLFLVHLLACICGSIINGQRLELSRMIALSMDKASFGK